MGEFVDELDDGVEVVWFGGVDVVVGCRYVVIVDGLLLFIVWICLMFIFCVVFFVVNF